MRCRLLSHLPVCRRLAGRVGGFNDAFDVGVAPFSQLCRDGTGYGGSIAAFVAEVAIAFILMTVILYVSNNSRLHKLTGLCAGALVMDLHHFEAPISGMSMNPARSFRLSSCRTALGRFVDLFHCAAHWHVVGGRNIFTFEELGT